MARRQSPTRHSERAKRNTRNGIELRMAVIIARMAEIHEEIKLYRAYKKKGLNARFINRVITALNKKLANRRSQLARYKARYARLKREGKI